MSIPARAWPMQSGCSTTLEAALISVENKLRPVAIVILTVLIMVTAVKISKPNVKKSMKSMKLGLRSRMCQPALAKHLSEEHVIFQEVKEIHAGATQIVSVPSTGTAAATTRPFVSTC